MTNEEIWLYKRGGSGGGTTVIPNPEGTATGDLTKIQIDDDIYAIHQPDLTDYLTSNDVGTAAISNSYNDLDNKPTIPTVPTNVSSFTNDAGYLVEADLSGYVEASDLANVATSGLYSDLSGTPTIPDVVVANPQDTATADLEKVKIGATVYDIPTGGGGGFQMINGQAVDTGNKWIDGSPIYCYESETGNVPNPSSTGLSTVGCHFIISAIKVTYNDDGMFHWKTYDVTSNFFMMDVGYNSCRIMPENFTAGNKLILYYC